jgi:hypothetical protein
VEKSFISAENICLPTSIFPFLTKFSPVFIIHLYLFTISQDSHLAYG